MVKINFGLEYDDKVLHPIEDSIIGEIYLGSKQLLNYFEQIMGLSGVSNNNDFLRIEQFRQVIDQFLAKNDQVFFSSSFKVDALATADAILQKRDELVLSGWKFEIVPNMPTRLKVITELELFSKDSETNIDLGFADRFRRVLHWIPLVKLQIDRVFINEPKKLLPNHFVQIFDLLKKEKVNVEYRSEFEVDKPKNDLERWQFALKGKNVDQKLKGDGSLMILTSKRDTNAANWLARYWRKNPDFVDAALLGYKNPILDNALMKEGMPSLGILSTSEVRPTLQILKLVTTFFWYPIDPFKILEFASLVVKPLNRRLGWVIAKELASQPGLFSQSWNLSIANYFKSIEADDADYSKDEIEEIKFQYRFWFNRTRSHIGQSIAKSEVKEVYAYLAHWAYQEFENTNGNNNSLIVVSEQAKRMVELLDTLPEHQNGLTQLELDRLVQVIYESAPVILNESEVGHIPVVYHNTSFSNKVNKLLWWGFGDQEKDYFFSNWYQHEFDFFESVNLKMITPVDENKLKLWQRAFPVLNTSKSLYLVTMDKIDGQDIQQHPLMGDLKATFDNLDKITIDIDEVSLNNDSVIGGDLPNWDSLEAMQFTLTDHLIEIEAKYEIFNVERHSFTSLESLMYYPHTWVLRTQCKLYPVSILSIHSEPRLMGNLSHRFFELLLNESGILDWAKDDIFKWIDESSTKILAKEGAVLLMYGREPDKEAFLHRVKTAAWTFISILNSNNWTIGKTESKLTSEIDGIELRGIADLVLERGKERAIIDFKWKGKHRRQQLLSNEEDLQLVLYLEMLDVQDQKHTAYYILSDSVLLSRNRKAFKEADCKSVIDDHISVHNRILNSINKTYLWRKSQLEDGQLEVRLERNVVDLDMAYLDENGMELLEMKRRNAPFDDYAVLVGDLS